MLFVQLGVMDVSYRLASAFFLCASFMLGGCGSGSTNSIAAPEPERIQFPGIGFFGIFDPSVAKDPSSNRFWMSYSVVDPASHFDISQQFAVGVRMAYSDDSGVTWNDAGIGASDFVDASVGPLPDYPDEPEIPAGSNASWNSEVSSLVYDPGAPVSERWKLIWHQYLKANDHSYLFSYGWLAMKMAASPLELVNATPIKLFAGIGLRSESEGSGLPAHSPIAGAPAIELHNGLNDSISVADIGELSNCVFTEPGLMATGTALYLTMDCHDASDRAVSYTPLFKCNSPCAVTDSNSWAYLGRVADFNDAADIGRLKLNAPQLVEKGGSYYLIVTPVEETPADQRYSGCRVYQFEDIDGAVLRRTNGVLVELERVEGTANSFRGACSDHKELQTGILYGQVDDTDPPEVFRIFQSFITVP